MNRFYKIISIILIISILMSIPAYKQFKKYTRKKWYSISNAEKEQIKEFFAKYPGGVVTFG